MHELELNKVIVELVKQFAQPVVIGVKALGIEKIDKIKATLNLCFTKYIERNYERYSKTKTILYRQIPVALRDYYVRTDLSLGHNSIVKESDFILEIEKNRRLVVTGTAGSGKSTFCKSLFIELIQKPIGIIPIFVELRHLNSQEGQGLYEYVLNMLTGIEPSFSREQLEHSLQLGRVLLVFDGFDEINNEKREAYEKEIINLSNVYNKIMLLVSSRPDDRFSSWEEFYHYNILPLDKEKAMSLIEKLEYDRNVKEKFLQELDEILYIKHMSFSQNPLLLTMMLLTYEQIAEIPNKIHLFYEQAFLTLFNKHDSLKSLYKRKSLSGLPLDDFKKALSAFCVISYSDRKYFFNHDEIYNYLRKSIQISGVQVKPEHFLNDLLDCVCIMQKDGLGYTFTHRSFQEYFTALFLVGMASDNKYDVFNKITFVNDRDDVIPMVFDINCELLEKEWIIPRLESLVSEFSIFPSTYDGKVQMLSKMYKGLVIHEHDPEEGENKEFSVAYRLNNDNNDHARFLFVLYRLYTDDMNTYIIKNRKIQTNAQLKSEEDLIRLDILNEGNGFLGLEDLSKLTKATKSRIARSGCCEHVVSRVDYCKYKLAVLRKKHNERKDDITELLLGNTTASGHTNIKKSRLKRPTYITQD